MQHIHHCRNPEVIDECNLDDETKKILLENIKRRLTPQSVKIRAGNFGFVFDTVCIQLHADFPFEVNILM